MSQPTQTEDPDAQPTQKEDPDAQSVQTITRKIWRRFRRNELNLTCVSETDLAKYNFRRTRIDFTTGTPDDGGPKLFEPLPEDKLGIQNQDLERFIEDVTGYGDHTNFHIARMVVGGIQYLLSCAIGSSGVDSNKTVIECGPWYMNEFPDGKIGSLLTAFILYPRDGKSVDLKCLTAVDHDLQDDTVYWTEFYATCAWLMMRFKDMGDSPRETSVTVITFSSKRCRISQVYYTPDRQNPMNFRQSDIVTLDGTEVEEVRPQATSVLGWLLAESRWKSASDRNLAT
ncbi:hypothetical protein F4809DRAFT_634145 [Biscogniauxia mediterranea]|nr:hypothetical protein F4809DRAFT_634145 [Biscogniauxia mediterranea]